MLVTNSQALIHNEVVMKDFRQLKVWEKAHLLALAVYPITARFPREETYGLTAQIRRAACSIPANIAEGCGRDGDAELARFCVIARGSATELEYQLLLARFETPSARRLRTTLAADYRDQTHAPSWFRRSGTSSHQNAFSCE